MARTLHKEQNMKSHKILSSLAVAAALLAPGLVQTAFAQTHAVAQVGPVSVRVYDRSHKDYHDWNADEDRTYRTYLTTNHQSYRPISKLSRSQQTKYWNTRHQ
jgi:hypothetical protein